MSGNHKTQIVTDNDGLYVGRCECGWTSGANHLRQKWMVEDVIRQHVEYIERVKATLHRGTGSLKRDMMWARQMIDDPDTIEADRVLWQMLHDSYARRLGEEATIQDQLF